MLVSPPQKHLTLYQKKKNENIIFLLFFRKKIIRKKYSKICYLWIEEGWTYKISLCNLQLFAEGIHLSLYYSEALNHKERY